jgi:thiol-disulfide isomerase/thioredoxin
MREKLLFFTCLILFLDVQAQPERKLELGSWRALLQRTDGHAIVFNFLVGESGMKRFLDIRNAAESIRVDDIQVQGDSIFIRMPFFDSQIRASFSRKGMIRGSWIKRLKDQDQRMPFMAYPNQDYRFLPAAGPARINVSGRWAVTFRGPGGSDSTPSVGEFIQHGSQVTGTFLNPTGDYRYLEGIVSGDSLVLSCFDGSHAYLFTAEVIQGKEIRSGYRFSGPTYKEIWTAKKDSLAELPNEFTLTRMKPGQTHLDFAFRDLNGKRVSIQDPRFKNKVILVQIMGSWCPNCLDETRFLCSLYPQYHKKGFEIIALAYERSTDFARSQKSLRSFQERLSVPYPILITGVTDSDTLQAEKSLPQLEKIEGFPTTIFMNKSGEVAKIHTGFNGPATGKHYEEEKRTFTRIIDELLAQ